MILGKVVGTVVSTRRADGIDAPRYLLVDPCDHHGNRKNDALVALDMIGARHDEMVLLCQGSPCRQTQLTDNKPFDALIAAIVDEVDEQGETVYRKFEI